MWVLICMNVIKSGYFLLLMSHIDFITRPAQEEESLFLPHSSIRKYTHKKQVRTYAKAQFFIWVIEGRTVEGPGGVIFSSLRSRKKGFRDTIQKARNVSSVIWERRGGWGWGAF